MQEREKRHLERERGLRGREGKSYARERDLRELSRAEWSYFT